MKQLPIGTIALERRNPSVNNEDAKRFWELFDKDALDEDFDTEDLVYSGDVVNERVAGGNRWQDVVCTIVKMVTDISLLNGYVGRQKCKKMILMIVQFMKWFHIPKRLQVINLKK